MKNICAAIGTIMKSTKKCAVRVKWHGRQSRPNLMPKGITVTALIIHSMLGAPGVPPLYAFGSYKEVNNR